MVVPKEKFAVLLAEWAKPYIGAASNGVNCHDRTSSIARPARWRNPWAFPSIVTEPRELICDLDRLPMPRWDLLHDLARLYRPATGNYRKLPSTSVVTSRGCPYECAFCDRSVHGRKWRAHSPETVLDWVDHLVSKYGIADLNFQDDHFTVNKQRLAKICDGIMTNHPQLIWSALTRADSIDPESLKLMKKSGCWQLAFGIETASPEILKVLQKGETIEQIIESVRLTKEAGITVKGLFMVGCPLETPETLKATANLIDELQLDSISVSAFTPLPGTIFFDEWSKWGQWEDGDPHDWSKMSLWQPSFVPFGISQKQLRSSLRCPQLD